MGEVPATSPAEPPFRAYPGPWTEVHVYIRVRLRHTGVLREDLVLIGSVPVPSGPTNVDVGFNRRASSRVPRRRWGLDVWSPPRYHLRAMAEALTRVQQIILEVDALGLTVRESIRMVSAQVGFFVGQQRYQDELTKARAIVAEGSGPDEVGSEAARA